MPVRVRGVLEGEGAGDWGEQEGIERKGLWSSDGKGVATHASTYTCTHIHMHPHTHHSYIYHHSHTQQDTVMTLPTR